MNVKQYIIGLEEKVKTLEAEVTRLNSELNDMMDAKFNVEKELAQVYREKQELEKKLNGEKIVEIEPQITTVVGVSGKDIQVETVLGSQISIDAVEKKRVRKKKVEPEKE